MPAGHHSPFIFIGNHRALDFVNTEVAAEGTPRDLLTDLGSLTDWLLQAGAVDRGTARRALERWTHRGAGTIALAQARALRSALRRLADAAARGRAVPRVVIDSINQVLTRGTSVTRIVSGASGFTTRPGLRLEEPADLLVPVAEAAADLLCHADLGRIRRCAHPECVLYFLDGTKNGTRRWCDMRTCGNRANAAAYYRRHRPGAGA
jgi:predicted RNA-binding Zn ribbon-like protein